MMKSYPSLYIYFNVIILSILIIMSSNNWFFTWMGFELSLFGFLPLFSTNSSTTEAIMKYFLMQASGSTMFMISFLAQSKGAYLLSILGMTMKLGLFPFFQWMPIVMMSLTWAGCMVLTTLQKLAPILVMMSFNISMPILFFSITSVLFSALLGFNQSLMRILMAYSSISHTSMIVMTFMFSMNMGVIYLLFYFSMVVLLFRSFKQGKVEKVNSLQITNTDTTLQTYILLMMTGMPPFSIFLFKVFLITMLMNFPVMIMIILLSTFISTYYYLSFVIPTLLFNKNKKKINLFLLPTVLLWNLTPIMFMLLLTKTSKFDC